MNELINNPDFESVLAILSVPQMQEICRNAGLEFTGNTHVLKNRLRRHIIARKEHDEFLRVQFPGLPLDLAEKSFEIQILLEKFRAPVSRSTVNFSSPPSTSTQQSISSVGNVSTANQTMIASSQASSQASANIEISDDQNLNQTHALNQSLLAGDLGDFGQNIVANSNSGMNTCENNNSCVTNAGFHGNTCNNLPINFQSLAQNYTIPSISRPISSFRVANPLNANAENFTPNNNVVQTHTNFLGTQAQNFSATMPQNFSGLQNIHTYELFTYFMQFMQMMNTQQAQCQVQNILPVQNINSDLNTANSIPISTAAEIQNQNTNQSFILSGQINNENNFVNDSHIPEQNYYMGNHTRNIPVFNEVPILQPRRYMVDVKRISYISTALEKKKKFFTGRAGSDPYKFMADLEESIRFLGLSEDEIFCCLPAVLQNEALEWFRLEESNLKNFQNFKRLFLEHYSVPYFQDRIVEELRLRTQGKHESIQAYVTCLRLLFNKMDPPLPLERQLDKAVQNLNPTYAFQINRRDVNSFSDLLTLGKQVEVKLLNIHQYREPPPAAKALLSSAAYHPPKEDNKSSKKQTNEKKVALKAEVSAVKDSNLENLDATASQTKNSQRKDKVYRRTANQVGNNAPKSEIKNSEIEHGEMPKPSECFKCRTQGHKFTDCKRRAVFKRFCYGCGRANKIKPDCPTCKKPKKENEEGGQSE